jgi:hypothetical protein
VCITDGCWAGLGTFVPSLLLLSVPLLFSFRCCFRHVFGVAYRVVILFVIIALRL